MKYYLYTDTFNWADECDVYFAGIIEEPLYQKYQYAQKELKEFLGSYYFGTNEGWDDDFDYLCAEFTELTENELSVLTKFGLPKGEDYVERFFDLFLDKLYDDFDIMENFSKEKYPDLYKYRNGSSSDHPFLEYCSLETFKEIVDFYKNEIQS